MTLYEYRSSASWDVLSLDESFEPDYTVEHRQLTDAEIIDLRIQFASYYQSPKLSDER
jgi:hypothetical protein